MTTSPSIFNVYADGYNATLYELSQQKGSVLENAVRRETRQANRDYFDRRAPSEVVEKTSRFEKAPLTEIELSRRAVDYAMKMHYPALDKDDEYRLLADPTSKYVQDAVMAIGRDKDKTIINAAFGTAYSGQYGTTGVAYDTNMNVAKDFGGGGDVGLTVKKLREARRLILGGDVDKSTQLHIAATADEIDDLLADTSVTSNDFNNVKALVQGEVDTFVGFKFHRISKNILPTNAAGSRLVLAWAEDGLLFSMGAMESRIIKRHDIAGAPTQVQTDAWYGAVRMEEAKVSQIACA
jgi:hypothetical protein